MSNPSLSDDRARRAKIAEQISALQAEDKGLAYAQDVLESLAEGDGGFHIHVKPRPRPLVVVYPTPPRGQAHKVLEVMRDSPKVWWKSADLAEAYKERFGAEIVQASLHPLLSKLKNDGIIVRVGRNVALPEKSKASPSEPEEAL